MTAPNSNLTQITAITRKYFLPKLYDNIFDGTPLLRRAKSKGWKRTIDGGDKVIIPLEYAVNASAGSYQGADTLSTADTDIFSGAELDWKQYYVAITISRRDELRNMGQSQVVDFVKSKVKNAEKTMKRNLTQGLYSDGTTATDLVGLRKWVNADETVGGISQSSNSWWQAQEDASTTTLTIAAMQTQFNACSEDDEQPTVVMATKANYNRYYALLQPQQRFTDSETAKGGFSSLMFNGVPVISDTYVPSNYMFFLNENHLHLLAHGDEDMRMSDFQEPINQNVKVAKLYWMGVFGSSNNRFHGDFTSISA